MPSLELELTETGAKFTALELKLPEGATFEQWSALGHKLFHDGKEKQWWLADWAAFGDKQYGKLKEFSEANGVNYQTIRNAAVVARGVPLSRRGYGLEWSFYKEVASLQPREQSLWLEKARDEGLSVSKMRQGIRMSKGESSALKSEGPSLKLGSKHCDDLVNWLQSRPPEFWAPERKDAWRKLLQPIVTFWEGLA